MNKLNCKNCTLKSTMFKSDIMVVGISAQKNTPKPLDPKTNSGKFIAELEQQLKTKFYKTNLTKCAPLKNGKIRYPTEKEYDNCYPIFQKEIEEVNPKTIILLGRLVSNFISKKINKPLPKYEPTTHKNRTYLPIDHPSYLMIYKRKHLKGYLERIILKTRL